MAFPNPFTAGAPTNDTDTMGTPMNVMGGPPIATAGLFAQHGSGAEYTWVQPEFDDTTSNPT